MSPGGDFRWLSGRCSRERHCDLDGVPVPPGSRFPLRWFGHITSTFLLPFAPPRFAARLHCYYESSDFCRAASSVVTSIAMFVPYRRAILHRRAWAIRQAVSLAANCDGSSFASCARQFSLLFSFDLPTIPPPTTALPFRHDRFVTLLHRRGLPRLSPGQTSKVGGIAVARSRVRTLLGASPTGLAESSSHKLRTGRSSQVALHPSSRKRSYHCRLQAGNVSLRGTSTLQIKRLHRRTSRHTPCAVTARSASGRPQRHTECAYYYVFTQTMVFEQGAWHSTGQAGTGGWALNDAACGRDRK